MTIISYLHLPYLKNKLLLISSNFTPKNSHNCLPNKNSTLCFPSRYDIHISTACFSNLPLHFLNFNISEIPYLPPKTPPSIYPPNNLSCSRFCLHGSYILNLIPTEQWPIYVVCLFRVFLLGWRRLHDMGILSIWGHQFFFVFFFGTWKMGCFPEVTKAFVTRTVATSILGVWEIRSSMAEGLQSSRWIAGRAWRWSHSFWPKVRVDVETTSLKSKWSEKISWDLWFL